MTQLCNVPFSEIPWTTVDEKQYLMKVQSTLTTRIHVGTRKLGRRVRHLKI